MFISEPVTVIKGLCCCGADLSPESHELSWSHRGNHLALNFPLGEWGPGSCSLEKNLKCCYQNKSECTLGRQDMTCPLCWVFSICPSDPPTTLLCARRSNLYKLHWWATFPSSFPLHLVNGKLWQEITVAKKCEKGLFIPSAPSPEGTIYNWGSQLLPANPLYIACPVSRPCWLLSLFLRG